MAGHSTLLGTEIET